jgi:NodT family efflux transporter outer membrane factor (OMF) lipoprotein
VNRHSLLHHAFQCASGALLLALAACASGPDYVRPELPLPPAFKEAGPWKPAQPMLVDISQPWWTRYGDAELDALVAQANTASQDILVAEANYRQAQAAAQLARSAYAPTVTAALATGRARTQTPQNPGPSGSGALNLSASWEPDIWGRVQRSVEAGEAGAEASAADLAAARLSIQAALVQDYLQLRVTDAQKELFRNTVQQYQRALAVARSQYKAGIVTRSDVALAESQLQSANAQLIDLDVQRSQFEHAIAFLAGKAPAELTIAPRPEGALGATLPAVPAALPSQLLERRPDIAAAERRAAAANANIGVAQAAYFPDLVLSAGGGLVGAGLPEVVNAPGRVWSLGATLAGLIFDGGARKARSEAALAAYDAAVAAYKRTVLAGLQEVEDNLATLRVLESEREVQQAAVAAAEVAARASLAQYRAGTANYLAVVTSQTLLLSNQRTAVQLQGRQFVASAALVKAVGGGWHGAASVPAAAQAGPAASPLKAGS